MTRNRLYATVGILSAGGYLWLRLSRLFPDVTGVGVCLFKHVTGIPCPSCGVTRSVGLTVEGHFMQAFLMNPIGLLLAPLLIVFPVWIIVDLIKGSDSFHRFYLKTERFLRRPAVAIPLVIAVLANWAWGISKGL